LDAVFGLITFIFSNMQRSPNSAEWFEGLRLLLSFCCLMVVLRTLAFLLRFVTSAFNCTSKFISWRIHSSMNYGSVRSSFFHFIKLVGTFCSDCSPSRKLQQNCRILMPLESLHFLSKLKHFCFLLHLICHDGYLALSIAFGQLLSLVLKDAELLFA
jgi:hypothetical protein